MPEHARGTHEDPTGEISIRAADLEDLSEQTRAQWARVVLLSGVAAVLVVWALFEASTPVLGMLAGLVALLPLKRAVRSYHRLATERQALALPSNAGAVEGGPSESEESSSAESRIS